MSIAAIAAELVIMICGPVAAAIWIRWRFAVPGRVFWIAAGSSSSISSSTCRS
ncbi:hypothetical protein [Saccharopolyspora hattusasensis]|uniref:hypothetical protein n=1 Tax=Saccharopolyspora hattusasensis TaxID=1128679 RepID=UPI003D957DF7